MTLTKFFSQAGKFVSNNSPAILTAIGVTGALTTAYLTGTASFKAAEIIRAREEKDGYAVDPKLRVKHRTQLVWRLYVPAVGTGAVTVAAIIFANHIGTRRAAAVATAYSLSEKAFAEYKEKVLERIGASQEKEIRDEVAQDQVDRNPVSTREVIVTGSGNVLCFDAYTGRYFNSDMESLRKAQNDINFNIVSGYCATLSDFYELIGLPRTHFSDSVGWTADNKPFELEFSTTLSEDSRPCISIRYDTTNIVGGRFQ